MADFRYFLNKQGIQGRKGEKGDTGFSPTISVGTDTLDEYKLIIANESNSFETPNLRGNINIQDNGGTYLRYDTETKQISAQSMDAATADTVGGVRLSTEVDIVEMGAGSVVTPSDVADALPLYLEGEGAVTITQDELTSKTKIKVDIPSVNDLESRMSTAEAEIADIQTDVANLNNNKVAKTDLATTESAGVVKVDGTSITVTADGTISASPSGALPIASTTQLGGVKVDGTSIVADENGVISSVGGGGAGDVTASGDNEFTGNNTFKKSVRVDNSTDPYQNTFINYNGLSIGTSSGAEINIHDNLTPKPLKFIASKLTLSNAYDGSSESPIVTSDKLKAGENITLNKNAETGDITISSTGGGGGTPTNMVTTDTDQTITGNKTFSTSTTVTFGAGSAKTTIERNSVKIGDPTNYELDISNTSLKDESGNYTIDAGRISSKTGNINIIPNWSTQSRGDGLLIQENKLSFNGSEVVTKSDIATNTTAGIVKVDGTSVTIDSNGVISATGGGGSAPDNMVTTNTDQDITGKKTIVNSDGLCFKSTNSLAHSVIAQIVNTSSSVPNTIGKVTILPDKSSGSRNAFARISYGILNDGNSNFPLYGKGGFQVTPVVDDTSAEARILLGDAYNGMGNIVGTTSGLTIGTGAAGSELSITSTDITFNGQSLLNSGGETPTNMVTTDTSQTITGAKTFTEPTVFKNTLDMSTGGTDTLYVHATGSYAEGYTTDIDAHKNLNIKTKLSGGAITLAPYNRSLNALKYKDSSNSSNPSYDILHTGNLVTGNNITISEPNSTGVRTISGPSDEYMASMAFPSTNYVNLNLGASGASYTAPADGYVAVSAKSTKDKSSVQIIINSSSNLMHTFNDIAVGAWARFYIPVRKGQTFNYEYNGQFANNSLVFVYAIGSQPTA